MLKLDRLVWMDGITFTAYGVRVGIRVNDPAYIAQLRRYLPPGSKPARSDIVDRLFSVIVGGEGTTHGVRRFNLLYENHVQIARTLELKEVFDSLESTMRLYIAEWAKRRVFVHAGVVGWHGRAIIIPGRSFSGKTTLVAELVRAGATYYSDEYAVLDEKGRVHPFPKPLSLRLGGGFEQTDFTVEELGGQAGVNPLPVGLVLMSEFREGTRWRPKEISAGQGALALLANTVSARRAPEKALAALQQAVAGAKVLKGTRGEASEIVNSILEEFDEIKNVPISANSGKLCVA
ncbi:MAG: hypothetical protein WCB68_15985 [Pyrinomonadaceae bacterium]